MTQLDYRKIALAIIILVFIIAAGLIITLMLQTQQPNYSDVPDDWIDEDRGTMDIDVSEASDGHSRVRRGAQEIPLAPDIVAGLFVRGSYQGQLFEGTLLGLDGNPVMRISPDDINPNDGVPEGYAVAKLKTYIGEPVESGGIPEPTLEGIYIYIDEDWKTQANNHINILWSNDFYDTSTIEERAFDWSKNTNGLYYDVVDTNIEWIMQTSGEQTGRVVIGPLSVSDILTSDLTQTMMILS